MKRENKGIKKLIACLMCAVMIGSAIACMPEFSASATDGITTEAPKQTYGEWRDAAPVNGSFEVGVEGQEVYGWKLIPCGNQGGSLSGTAGHEENYTITTERDETTGNQYMKMAPVNKTQGYVFAQSEYVSITAGQKYKLTYDLKVTGENTGGHTPRVKVYYYDSSYNALTGVANIHDYTVTDWTTFAISDQAPSETAFMTVNLYMSGKWATDYVEHCIDNVSVMLYGDSDIINGDFESQTTTVQKSTSNGNIDTDAPVGWTMLQNDETGTTDGGTGGNTAYYAMVKDKDESGDYCMKMYPCYGDQVPYGWVRAQSNYMPVDGGQFHTVSYDLKVKGKTELSKYNPKMIIYYYDNTKTQIATTTNAHTYDVTTWTRFNFMDKAPENAEYMTVNFYIGGARSDNNGIATYVDNVSVKVRQANEVVNGDFSAMQETGVAGWKLIPCGSEGGSLSGTAGHEENYTITTERDETTGNQYMKMAPVNKTQGYVFTQSEYISITAGQNYKLTYDLKVTGETTNNHTPRVKVYYYDSSYNALTGVANIHDYTVTDWTTFAISDQAPSEAAFMTVNLYMGGKWTTDYVEHYIDNVSVKVYQADEVVNGDFSATHFSSVQKTGVVGWKLIPCGNQGGSLSGTAGHEANYTITTERDETTGNQYMKMAPVNKTQGYVFAQSEYISITAGQKYKLTYDLKVTGENTGGHTPRVKVYYYDSSYNALTGVANIHDYTVTDWTTFAISDQAPSEAAFMTVNLYMSGKWATDYVEHYFDNVSVERTVTDTDSLKTDLLFVMLQGGNAVDATSESCVDICDLIHMKKYIAGEVDGIFSTADMNNNSTINNADVLLLEWKLLGVTTTEQAKSVR